MVLLLLLPEPVWADPATDARIHFQAGVAFVKKGRLAQALERFLMANRLAPNPNIVFNIALCLDRLGRREEAFVYYRELLEQRSLPAGDRARARAALSRILPHVARLSVVTEPAGATIYVDRRALGAFGRTPRVLAVKPGQHRIITEKPGYEEATTQVTAVKGRKTLVRLRLERITGKLLVTTNAPGSEIRVDDETTPPVGRTPCTLRLPPGPHTVFLRANGYQPAQRRLVIRAYQKRRLVVALTALPPPTGTLQVEANVMGALVELDGMNLGIAPLLRRDIRAGKHRITVHAKGHNAYLGRFELPPDGLARVAVQLERTPRRRRWGPWPWITLGVTGLSLVAAVTMGGLALANHRSYESAAAPTMSDLRRGEAYNIAADTLLGATAAAGLATAVTFLLLKPDPDRPSTGQILVRKPGATRAVPARARPARRRARQGSSRIPRHATKKRPPAP